MTYHIRVRAGALILENESILLVEFKDEKGLHYNLPSGGVEPGESIIEAVRREAEEEASVDVEVGPLAFVYEYAPHLTPQRYGDTHSLGLMFDCKIKEGSIPMMPEQPDLYQTDVTWVKLTELKNIVLYPNMKDQIIAYSKDKKPLGFIEEQTLKEYI
ncbi:NUDIX hydrolase [Bacillus sp. FJAT-27225]|uniref:NUDIX domain-containing protein n=1 Tax=Bacillus sp. FJAT-27225 TaxID=1743144 RepID=UPI00080C34A9|nr:NUDIX domain-containing protein [Bacillus sp. FJAT-27225]OCA83126.1 NUDIX hydrolase [Bacillus sp. FJAT-27225]